MWWRCNGSNRSRRREQFAYSRDTAAASWWWVNRDSESNGQPQDEKRPMESAGGGEGSASFEDPRDCRFILMVIQARAIDGSAIFDCFYSLFVPTFCLFLFFSLLYSLFTFLTLFLSWSFVGLCLSVPFLFLLCFRPSWVLLNFPFYTVLMHEFLAVTEELDLTDPEFAALLSMVWCAEAREGRREERVRDRGKRHREALGLREGRIVLEQ